MKSRYYQHELDLLRVMAAEFSKAHPAVAPLLSGPSSDPDVERLLEGTAYLTGQLSQSLDEGYDRIAESIAALVLPQLLRDIPSCTMLQFSPKGTLRETLEIPKGTRVASVEVDGIPCVFSTAYPVELAPLRLADATLTVGAGRACSLRLDFDVLFPPALPAVKRLRLHLRGQRTDALMRHYTLSNHTRSIVFEWGDTRHTLPGNALSQVGFAPEEWLFPYPPTAWPGYRSLQEYFVLPEKFLFVDLLCPNFPGPKPEVRSFSCTFDFGGLPAEETVTFSPGDFALFATPAVNLFPFETTPIRIDQSQDDYLICANASPSQAYVPYSVKEVRMVGPTSSRISPPLLGLGLNVDPFTPSYSLRRSADGSKDMRLLLHYPPDARPPEPETVSLSALYTNGGLPAKLHTGDVRIPLSTSPSLADFTNITPPTPPVDAPGEGNVLWSVLAHLHLNYLPMADAETLRALLEIYLPRQMDALYGGANRMRLESLREVRSETLDHIWRGHPIRGTAIEIRLDEKGFSNVGDMHLFGLILATFLNEYSTINSFVHVHVSDTLNRYGFSWQKHP
jgi:type VI secretion system protein ImpG